MRFAILFAGLMIAVSVDEQALWNNFSFWFVYPTLFAMLYVDLIDLALDNKDRKKEIKEERNKTREGD